MLLSREGAFGTEKDDVGGWYRRVSEEVESLRMALRGCGWQHAIFSGEPALPTSLQKSGNAGLNTYGTKHLSVATGSQDRASRKARKIALKPHWTEFVELPTIRTLPSHRLPIEIVT